MVSRKIDVNFHEFVAQMSAGLPVTTPASIPNSSNTQEASKNPFLPSLSSPKPLFVSPPRSEHQRVVEDAGLQVVPLGSTAQTQSRYPLPGPPILPLNVATGGLVARVRNGGNPFRSNLDAEGLQAVSVSPITPGSHACNAYPTPISLQTPLGPWSLGQASALNDWGNALRNPRYTDAEGMQAVVSNLGLEEPEETLDSYAVSSPTNVGARDSLPYPLTPKLRNNQPASRWGDPWAHVLKNPFPNNSNAHLGNYPVLPPRPEAMVAGNDDQPTANNEILIAVFGMTGTGKTTFIEKVSGQRLNVGHNLRSCTMNIQKIQFKIGNHNITLVDTPGFDDTSRSDTDVLIQIANWLRDSYKEATLLSGIIYLHRISDLRISDLRMSGSSIKNLRMFRKLCGAESMHNVSLVTTMWDKVTRVEGEMREKDLMDAENGFWRIMISGGCLVRRHSGSVESARGLVAELAEKKRTVLRLQEEIAEGKKLIETEAGVSLNEELLRVQRQHEEELRCVMEEMEAAMKSGNEALQKELASQHDLVISSIEDRASQQAALLNTRAWDLEDQLLTSNLTHSQETASLEARVESLSDEQMRSFYGQEELRNQIRGLRRVLTDRGGGRGGGDHYRSWICTRRSCGKVFYAPREQREIWCAYCGRGFKTREWI